MVSSEHQDQRFLEIARQLAPQVAELADLAAREREIPTNLANEIADKGLFRLLVPKSVGGHEIDYLEFLAIVQTFAEIDGSTAWCVNQKNNCYQCSLNAEAVSAGDLG